MKFGILNAWYVPGGTQDLGLRQDQTAINTFPTLFDKYFGLDYPTLPDTVYAAGWARPYSSIDVTDEAAQLEVAAEDGPGHNETPEGTSITSCPGPCKHKPDH